MSETTWTPPFCSTDTVLDCPACKAEGAVRVREQETYLDASDYEGYCCECHVELTVWASVDISFNEAEVA